MTAKRSAAKKAAPPKPDTDDACESFPPLVAEGARVLVIGSMPGVISLRAQRYYANPHNLFWRVMGELAGAHPELPYEERVARLRKAGIAVWDTLKSCERGGSLDSAIVRATEVPNDFDWILRTYPTIRVVAFNGGKSRDAFRRHVLPILDPMLVSRIEFLAMPSTSPANASQKVEEKLARWRRLAEFVKPVAG